MENVISRSDLPSILKVGEAAARAAGTYLRQKLGEAKVEYQKAAHDDLLDVDLEAERIILTQLRQKTPQLEILSEETAPQAEYKHYWIVDPLDGSANFQHGNPLFAIALALVLDQTTLASVVYIPMQDEMFTAIKDQGAFLNGKRIQVSNTSTIDEAIAHLGDFTKGNNSQTTHQYVSDILTLATKVSRVRMIGTAATDLAYVACGRADLLVDHATTPWDTEAGKMLLLEAGGKATTKQIGKRTVNIYSNGRIHQEVEDLFNTESQQ